MTLPITSLFAALFGILMLVLWINVTKTRARADISIGHGDDAALHEKVRRHGNFMEWVPITLILLALAEMQGLGAAWLYAEGLLALVGRLIHPFGLTAGNASHPLRIMGNSGNLLATLILVIALLLPALGG